jgi:LysR family transcriptional regulator, benzoate and cis,cis-muconate-responsive activator of ben and cat genes
MELRHLRYFRAVGREQHFGRAAKILHVAQPALTRQIRHLEEELGVALFERRPRGVQLSAAGRMFLNESEAILAHVDRSVEKARSYASGHFGTVRVGFSEIASGHREIPSKLLAFRLHEPNVTLELLPMSSQDQIEAVKDAEIDAAIVYDVHHDESNNKQLLDAKEIGESEIVLALYKGHPLAAAKQIRMKDLRGESFLWPFRKRAPSYSEILMRACVAHGVVPNVIQETATHSILLSLVAVGMGIGFVEYSEHRVQSSSVVLRKVSDLNVSFKIRVCWRKSDESVALSRFLDAMGLPGQSPGRTSPAAPVGQLLSASGTRGVDK